MNQLAQKEILVDNFGRRVNYVRLSVTDRCDFRCVYCMSESMTFLPKESILSLEEIGRIAKVFSELGVEKVRLTGGEPLVRRDVMQVIDYIGGLGLKDFAMTTNGSQLPRFAKDLKASGLKRLNISLDSLNPEKFKRITRTGHLQQVLDGIDAAINAGFTGIKLNAVIMKGRNEDEVLDLVEFARHKKIDISFIEEMPLGVVSDHERGETYCSSDEVRKIITSRYSIKPVSSTTAGPSRYYQMPDSTIHLGFISPHSHNFCGDCNRVRVTVEGRLLLCLGNEHSIDLRPYLRNPSPKGQPHNDQPLKQAIIDSMAIKPERHHFTNDGEVQVVRMMNMTGG